MAGTDITSRIRATDVSTSRITTTAKVKPSWIYTMNRGMVATGMITSRIEVIGSRISKITVTGRRSLRIIAKDRRTLI